MERCNSCQGELEPTTRRCRRCGQIQPLSATAIPVQVVNGRSKYCPHCGHPIRANARFCGNCGMLLHWIQEQSSSDKDHRFAIFDQITLLQTILVAVLLATQVLPQPTISSGVSAQSGIAYSVPLASFLMLAVSLAVGYWFVLAGALRSYWSVCVPVIALLTGILAIQPLIAIVVGINLDLFTPELWLSMAQLVVLAAFWLWALIILRQNRNLPAPGSRFASWHGWAFVGVLALLLIYYGLAFGIWLIYFRTGLNPAANSFLLGAIGGQVVLLPLILVLPILALSMDLLHRAQKTVKRIVLNEQGEVRFPRLLVGLTPLAVVAMIVNELRKGSSELIAGLVLIIILAGIVVLLVRFAQVDRNWPREMPSFWLYVGATFVFIDIVLIVDLNYFPMGLAQLVVSTLSVLLRVPIALGALTVALFLIVRGRMGRPGIGTGGLFLALVVLMVLSVSLPSTLAAFGLDLPQPGNYLGLMIVSVAAAMLVWMLFLSVRGQWQEAIIPFALILLLLIGLQLVEWVYVLLQQVIPRLSSLSTILLAALFLMFPLWDALKPVFQEQLAPRLSNLIPALKRFNSTGSDKKADEANPLFTEEGHVLLLAGYTLVSNALLLYLGTFHEPVTGAVLPSFLQSDLTASSGVLLLGIPLVVLGFVLAIRHLPQAASLLPGRRVSWQPTQRVVVGSGVLVTIIVTALLLTIALPRQIQASENQQYGPTIPGSDCDNGGANWSVVSGSPISISCLKSGLEVKIVGRSAGRISFIPPSGVFTQNYRVSVQVDFSHLLGGCVSIETRATSVENYSNLICYDGSWGIHRMVGKAETILALGAFRRATSYTIEATTIGANQRIAIDGTELGSVSDTTLTTTMSVNLRIYNFGSSMGSVIFSNFVFTPLP